MKLKLWGTRGSIPKPSAKMLRYGGNTSCLEIRSESGTLVVIDCGTGAHDLGQKLMAEADGAVKGAILISHTHWDHIQGFPFFAPLFVPGNKWDIYAPEGLNSNLRDTLSGQMQYTYFPITLETMGAEIQYHELVEGVFEVGDILIRTHYLNHPALTLGYRLEADGCSIAYICDNEPFSEETSFKDGPLSAQEESLFEFVKGADLVVHDAQYTQEEYKEKMGWGHSTGKYAVDFCHAAGVEQLALTHHDPMRDDDAVEAIEEEIRGYCSSLSLGIQVFPAAEAQEVTLVPRETIARGKQKEDAAAVDAVVPATVAQKIVMMTNDLAIIEMIGKIATEEHLRLISLQDEIDLIGTIRYQKPALVILENRKDLESMNKTCHSILNMDEGLGLAPPILLFSDVQVTTPPFKGLQMDWLTWPVSHEYVRTRIHAWILRQSCRWNRAPVKKD